MSLKKLNTHNSFSPILYEPVECFGGYENMIEIKHRDNIKINYCKNKNINLIIIPFNERKNIKKILDTEIN